MSTRKRIEKALKQMAKWRAILVNDYLLSVEKPVWDNEASMTAMASVRRVRDCDVHIESLANELKGLDVKPTEVDSILADARAEADMEVANV